MIYNYLIKEEELMEVKKVTQASMFKVVKTNLK